MNQQLMEESTKGNSAGVVVNLKNGTTTYADIEPYLLCKIMKVLTPEELGEVVNSIVESPDSRALCERVKDQ